MSSQQAKVFRGELKHSKDTSVITFRFVFGKSILFFLFFFFYLYFFFPLPPPPPPPKKKKKFFRGGHRVLQTLIRSYFSPAQTTGQRYIICGSATGDVCLYDGMNGEVVGKLKGHGQLVRDVAWHPSKPEIVSSSVCGGFFFFFFFFFFVCLFVCVFVLFCLFVYLFICLFVYLFVCLFVYLFICLFVYLFICLFVYLFICLFLFVYFSNIFFLVGWHLSSLGNSSLERKRRTRVGKGSKNGFLAR